MSLAPSSKINKMPRYSDKFRDVLDRINQKQHQEKQQKRPSKQIFFFRIRSIGIGAHSVVYLVQQDITKTLFAQKYITKQHALSNKQQLINEIKIHYQLDHPNIIKIYHTYEDQSGLFLIMQIGFDSLFSYLGKKQRLQENQVVKIIHQVLEGVKYLHDRKIVHADLKLQNVILNKGQVKICDFGYAYYFGQQVSKDLVGTTEYIAPQLVRMQNEESVVIDNEQNCWKRDIWAVGMICYQLLTGKNLLDGMSENQKWQFLLKYKQSDFGDIQISQQMKLFLMGALCTSENRRSAGQLLKLQIFKLRQLSKIDTQEQVSQQFKTLLLQ